MPSPSFQGLTQQLLDAGIAPKFAERLRRELEDHYRDLEREALADEHSAVAAELEARRRLGTSELIAHEFLSRPELRSWVYRSVWFVQLLRGACLIYLGLRRVAYVVVASRAALARFAAAGVAAAVLTASLLLALQAGIGTDPSAPGAVRAFESVRRAAVRTPDRPPDTLTVVAESTRDPLPEHVARPGFETPDVRLPDLPGADLGVRPMVAVDLEPTPGMPRMTPIDADLLPIVKIAPQFPALAAARGIEGYVLVEYTVTRTGSVSDIVVIESSSEVFERPVLEAVAKFRYRPRIVDGSPVPVRGVRTRLKFVLEA